MTTLVPIHHAEQLRDRLELGETVDDADFDRVYPPRIRRRSPSYWTPVAVAVRATALLAPEPGLRVLDVGAGCGKLCCLGALTSVASWHGVERDPDLVIAAQTVAHALGVDRRTCFTRADVFSVDWRDFESIYLFNPFEEALLADGPLRGPVHQNPRWSTYCREIEATELRLADMPTGTRVVTYHGFGGDVPGYRLAYRDRVGTDFLALWIKESHARHRRSA